MNMERTPTKTDITKNELLEWDITLNEREKCYLITLTGPIVRHGRLANFIQKEIICILRRNVAGDLASLSCDR